MTDTPAPATTGAQAVDDPVHAYLTRRLRIAEEEALAANMRLRQMRAELVRVVAIARRFEHLAREAQSNTQEADNGSR